MHFMHLLISKIRRPRHPSPIKTKAAIPVPFIILSEQEYRQVQSPLI